MKNFINKPIPGPLHHELLSKDTIGETFPWHDDFNAIPDVIEGLGKENEPGVTSAKQKDLWRYNANLVFKVGENIVCFWFTFQADAFNASLQQDLDLLNRNRLLIHTGKFLRQPDPGFEWSGWTELFAMLFDNYRRGLDIGCFLGPTHEPPVVVMAQPRGMDGVTKYLVYRRASRVQFRIIPPILTSAVSPSLWTFSL